jgi:hypothetical protein
VGTGCVILNSLLGMWITSHMKIGAVLGWGVSWRSVLLAEAVASAA